MKKLLQSILFLVSFVTVAAAQMTTVSGTVTDTDGTVWANGSWSVTFTPNPSQPNPAIYNINGTPLSPSVTAQSGALDGSGAFSFSVYQTATITPVGSSWTVKICPNAVTACGTYNFTAIGTTMNLSSALTPVIPAPRFKPVSGTYGYNDGEAILSLLPGSTYWNVTSSTIRCYNGTSWNSCSGGGGNPFPCTSPSISPGQNITCTGVIAAGSSPVVDIRAVVPPAVIDGVTDIAPSVNAALAQCGAVGGACEVNIPCIASSSGCWLNNWHTITNLNFSTKINVTGRMFNGTTVDYQNASVLWQGTNPTEDAILGPYVLGQIGTAVTTTGTAVKVTPTFTQGDLAHVPVGSAITIGERITCTIVTYARVSGVVTIVTSGDPGTCRIPSGTNVDVAGAGDFNVTQIPLLANGTEVNGDVGDYYNNTFTFNQGGANESGTGGTISGLNDDNYETVRILGSNGDNSGSGSCTTTAGQICFAPNHLHAATDYFGEAVFAPETSDLTMLRDIAVESRAGMAVWLEDMYQFELTNDDIEPSSYLYAPYVTGTMEMQSTNQGKIIATKLGANTVFGCGAPPCGAPTYPYSLHITQANVFRYPSGDGSGGFFEIDDSSKYIYGGIKMDNAGIATRLPPQFRFYGGIAETVASNFFQIDNRIAYAPIITVYGIDEQDFATITCLVGYTDRGSAAGVFNNYAQPSAAICPYNINYIGAGEFHQAHGTPLTNITGAPQGIMVDNGQIRFEDPGRQASFGPSIVPFATLPITIPGSCVVPSCTINTGIAGPDRMTTGPTSAIEIVNAIGHAGGVFAKGGSLTTAVHPNDRVLYWTWVRHGANFNSPTGFWGIPVSVYSGDSLDTLYFGSTGGGTTTALSTPFTMNLGNDGWYPIVGLGTFLTGNSSAHEIDLQLWPGDVVGFSNYFACWGWSFIPASMSIAPEDLETARRNLYHNCVPPNFNLLGMAASLEGTWSPIFQNGNPVLVSALPSCSTTTVLQRAAVTDATSAMPGTALVGSGTHTVAVECVYDSSGPTYGWIVD